AALLLWGQAWRSSPLFVVLALAHGVVQGMFFSAVAIFLSEGKASRVDFACALVMLLVAVPVSVVVLPFVQAMMSSSSIGSQWLLWFFMVCHVLALLVLLPCKTFFFGGEPARRHKPLPARQRSVWTVFLCTTSPLLAVLITVVFIVPRV